MKVARETAAAGTDSDYDPVLAAKDKADFLLTFSGPKAKAEVCGFVFVPYSALTLGYWHQRAEERHGNPPPR